MKTSGAVVVSWDFAHGMDVGVVLVGEQKNGAMEVINAFQGKEAEEIYKKLTTPKLPKKERKTGFVGGPQV